MSNIIGIIESAMDDADYGDEAVAAIETFLEAAAEWGWHMQPDEATISMQLAIRDMSPNEPLQTYRAMLAAAPEFKWKDDS